MPELPEIETVKLQLLKYLVGRRIERVEVRNRKTFHGEEDLLIGKKVVGVRRRAKVLLIDLEQSFTLAFHFKMSGQLILDKDASSKTVEDRIVGGHPTADFVGKLPSSHTRVIFYLDSGVMYFNDQRMFGWVKFEKTEVIEKMNFLEKLGPEPFDLNEGEFVKRAQKGKRAVKLVIMDQEIISGVGNIYANDALWEARIDPSRPINLVSNEEMKLLLDKIVLVLNEGIKYGGATAADAKYIDLHGLGGKYQEHFRTYDQEDKMCSRPECVEKKSKIVRIVLGGRGTFYCPNCQK